MNPDYTQAMLMSDIMATVQDNAPVVIYAAIFVGVVNFIIGWFMESTRFISRAGGR